MLVYSDIPLDRGESVLCERCNPGPAAEPAFLAVTEVESSLGIALDASPGTGVLLTGADPLRHPGFEQLLGALASAGTRRIGVRASGDRLADSESVAALLAAGVRLFEVPFPDPSGDSHDAPTGTYSSFDAAAHGVRTLLEAAERSDVRVAVRGLLGVCRHTAEELPASVMRLAELRVTSVALQSVGGPDAPRLAQWVGAACDTGTVNRVWVSVAGFAPELLGERALHATDVMTLTGVTG